MDATDKQILERLKDDGRASYTAIADDIGVSEGTVRNRVERLQADGVIEGFTVEVAEPDAITVFVMVTVDTDADIETILAALPDDAAVYEVTGDWDIILRFSRDSSTAVNDTLEAIRGVNGVKQTTTYTVLASRA